MAFCCRLFFVSLLNISMCVSFFFRVRSFRRYVLLLLFGLRCCFFFDELAMSAGVIVRLMSIYASYYRRLLIISTHRIFEKPVYLAGEFVRVHNVQRLSRINQSIISFCNAERFVRFPIHCVHFCIWLRFILPILIT